MGLTQEQKVELLMNQEVMNDKTVYLMDSLDILDTLSPSEIIRMTKHRGFDLSDEYFFIDFTYNRCYSIKDDETLVAECWNDDIIETAQELGLL